MKAEKEGTFGSPGPGKLATGPSPSPKEDQELTGQGIANVPLWAVVKSEAKMHMYGITSTSQIHATNANGKVGGGGKTSVRQ
jgi:hypothetical protein